jgi:hypothetical protein
LQLQQTTCGIINVKSTKKTEYDIYNLLQKPQKEATTGTHESNQPIMNEPNESPTLDLATTTTKTRANLQKTT